MDENSLGCCYSLICRNLKYRMVASKCISHFLQFILLLLELFLAMIFDMSAGSVSKLSNAKSKPTTCTNFAYIDIGHGRFVGR